MRGMTYMIHAKKGPFLKPDKVSALVIVLVLIMVPTMLLSGCDKKEKPAQTSASATTVETTPTGTTAPPETTVITETTATTEKADTSVIETILTEEAVTDTAPVATETVTQSIITDSPLANYIPPTDRDTNFSGCLFIGDSRTQGLILYSGVYGAENYTARGLTVDGYFSSAVIDMNDSKVSVAQAVESGPDFERVYIMLGINELGWSYESVFAEKYGNLVDHVKSNMPDAKIIVQSILPITPSRSASDNVFNNANVARFNVSIKNMCSQKGVTYLDLTPHMGDETGALPEGAAFDGIHLQKSYCQKWLDYLKANMN